MIKVGDYEITRIEQRCLMLPVHFNTPHCGFIERRGGTYAFVPSQELP